MEVFEAPSADAKVRGAAVQSVIDGVPAAFESRATEVLVAHGIESVTEDEWYQMQAYLDAYETIVDKIGEATLRQIGRTTPETAEWPPGVETPFDALEAIDDAYRMNHEDADGEIGYYRAQRLGDGSVEVTCRTPYPCTYEGALVEGTAELFAADRVSLTTLDGGDGPECVFEVEW